MDGSLDASGESVAWIADTGLFIACGRQQNSKFTALEAFTERNELTFIIPHRVFEELGGAPEESTPGQTPINSAIDTGWVTVADPPTYSDPVVSQVMDDVRTYIARSSGRSEDSIEKADTALAGVAVERLAAGIDLVNVVTTDIDAGEGTVLALEIADFGDRIEFVNGFDLIDSII